jgi:hypothetical protein
VHTFDAVAAQFDEMDDYWANPYDSATWQLENDLGSNHVDCSGAILDLAVGSRELCERTHGCYGCPG